MILVVPLGPNRPQASLPYALRAHEAHIEIDALITVGEAPEGIIPDLHIPSPNTANRSANVNGHMRAAATHLLAEGVGEFIWSADDQFPLAPWVPVCHVRRYPITVHLAHYPNIGGYSHLVREAIAIMKADGYDPDQVPCGAIHRPMLVDAKRALQTLDRLPPNGHFKVLYVAGLDGVVPAGDPKVKGRGVIAGGADAVSTDPPSWRYNAGRVIRETFKTPSRWETG